MIHCVNKDKIHVAFMLSLIPFLMDMILCIANVIGQ